MKDESPRIAFAGTPEFALRSLHALLDSDYRVSVVYTQPDRKAGRGRKLSQSPVKSLARDNALAIEQPHSLKAADEIDRLRSYEPDVLVVVAYGLILPPDVLAVPKLGCINVHASLLPRWRGAAPIQRAILAGDEETGISIMKLTAGLDCGPVLLQRRCSIGARQTAGDLHEVLSGLGAECLLQTLPELLAGRLVGQTQDESMACYAPKIDPREAEIDWSMPAAQIDRHVRAFNPAPGARALVAGHAIKIWAADPITEVSDLAPGSVVDASSVGIDVSTGAGIIRITRLQVAGRNAVSAGDFVNAHPELRKMRKLGK